MKTYNIPALCGAGMWFYISNIYYSLSLKARSLAHVCPSVNSMVGRLNHGLYVDISKLLQWEWAWNKNEFFLEISHIWMYLA